MPNATSKKSPNEKVQTTTAALQCEESTSSSAAGDNGPLNTSSGSNSSAKTRKR